MATLSRSCLILVSFLILFPCCISICVTVSISRSSIGGFVAASTDIVARSFIVGIKLRCSACGDQVSEECLPKRVHQRDTVRPPPKQYISPCRGSVQLPPLTPKLSQKTLFQY